MGSEIINGVTYAVIGEEQIPFGNACNHCVFKGSRCYDETSFSCHADSREDGRGVVFQEGGRR